MRVLELIFGRGGVKTHPPSKRVKLLLNITIYFEKKYILDNYLPNLILHITKIKKITKMFVGIWLTVTHFAQKIININLTYEFSLYYI